MDEMINKLLPFIIAYAVLLVYVFATLWMTFEKAGQPGWAALIPIYNTYILWKISTPSVAVLIMCLIPCTAPIGALMLTNSLAKAFGRSAAFGFFALFLFSPIGFSILAFSGEYIGPDGVGKRMRRSRDDDYGEDELDDEDDRPRRRR